MITEDYCSFELSKLLKEKGFDGRCVGCYWDSKKILNIHYELLSYSDGDLRDEVILAPTHQMAMKWLREKGYHIVVFTDSPKYEVKIQDLNDGSFNVSDITHTYDTFEETVEVAIKYCLIKLINNETN